MDEWMVQVLTPLSPHWETVYREASPEVAECLAAYMRCEIHPGDIVRVRLLSSPAGHHPRHPDWRIRITTGEPDQYSMGAVQLYGSNGFSPWMLRARDGVPAHDVSSADAHFLLALSRDEVEECLASRGICV